MNLSYHMLNLKNYIKQERIDVCNQLWKKFDKGNTGFINEKDLGTMLYLPENLLRSGEDYLLDDVKVSDIERELGTTVGIAKCDGRDLVCELFGIEI